MKQTRQGVPSWCHYHQTSPASSNLPSGWMWTDAWQPPRAFTSHSYMSKGMQELLHRSFCVTILFSQNRRCFYFLLSSITFIPAVSMSFALNRFPRCATVGVSLAKVVYSACLPLFLLPPKPAGGQKGPNPSSSAWPSSEPAHKNGALSLPLLSPPLPIPPPTPNQPKKAPP